jgi:hypothetical protein
MSLSNPVTSRKTSVESRGSAGGPGRSNTAIGAPSSLTHEQIAQRARDIWRAKGCPAGQDEQNWREAEMQLRAESRRGG